MLNSKHYFTVILLSVFCTLKFLGPGFGKPNYICRAEQTEYAVKKTPYASPSETYFLPFLGTDLKKIKSCPGGTGMGNCLAHGKHNKDFQQKNKFRIPEDIQKNYHLIFLY